MATRLLSIFRTHFASLYSILDQVVSLVFSFLLLILLARYLGAGELGKYQFAMSIVALILVITNFGLSAIANREIARSISKLPLYLGSALTIRIFLSLPLTIVFAAMAMALIDGNYETNTILLLAVFYSAILSNLLLMNGALFSLHMAKQVLIINGGYKILALLLVFACLVNGFNLTEIMTAQTLIVTAIFIAAYQYIKRLAPGFKLQCTTRFCRAYIKKSIPLLSISVAELISLRIDTVMLGVIKTTFEVGLYAGAYNIYLAGALIPLAVTRVFFPKFVALYTSATGRSAAFALMQRTTKLFLIYSLIAAGVLAFAADELIFCLFGGELSGAAAPLMILAFGIPLIAINRLYNYVLLGVKENGWYLRISVVAAISNIAMNLVLIPAYSMTGAALATILTEGLMLVLARIKIKTYYAIN